MRRMEWVMRPRVREVQAEIEVQRKANFAGKYFRYWDTLVCVDGLLFSSASLAGSWVSSFESEDEVCSVALSASGCNFLSQSQPRLKKIASDGALDQTKERDDGTTTPIPFPLLHRSASRPSLASVTRTRRTGA